MCIFIYIYQSYITFHSIFRLLIMRWNQVDLSKMLTAVVSMLQKNTFLCQISNQEETTQSPFRPCPKESNLSKDHYFKQHVSIDTLKEFWNVIIPSTQRDHFICITILFLMFTFSWIASTLRTRKFQNSLSQNCFYYIKHK